MPVDKTAAEEGEIFHTVQLYSIIQRLNFVPEGKFFVCLFLLVTRCLEPMYQSLKDKAATTLQTF